VEQKIIDLLKRSNLSITDSRKKILESFFQENSALAHADIEDHVGEDFDRVTIYRTLQTFVDKGIIHTIPTPENAASATNNYTVAQTRFFATYNAKTNTTKR
jgi:Fur family ferric uptake transcriptional regulator